MLLIRSINCNDIESAWPVRKPWVLSQIGARGECQLSLFRASDGLSSRIVVIIATVSDFNEHQAILIHHDYVDFAKSTSKISVAST